MFSSHSTIPYKLLYTTAMMVIISTVITGVLYTRDNPTLQKDTLFSWSNRLLYTIAFAFEDARGATAAATSSLGGTTLTYDASAHAESIPVLIYHGILPREDPSTTNMTAALFREHLFALKRAGYQTVGLKELYAFGRGERTLPEKSVVITFDDGRGDSFYNGDPTLAAVDYKAVMFPITKFSQETTLGGYYLSFPELKKMKETGRWEIGSHSHEGHASYPINAIGKTGHFFSNYLWKESEGRPETETEFRSRINEDFRISQAALENLLDEKVRSFAFPFGDLGQNQKDNEEKVAAIIEEASEHYDMLFYQYQPGEYFTQFYPDTNSSSDTLLIRRIDVKDTWSGDELLSALERGSPKELPYYDQFTHDRGWVAAWGSYRIADRTLRMEAAPASTGASIILDGTKHWTDYTIRARLVSPNQTGFLVWARFQNDNNNAGCNFGKNFVHVEQIVDGEKRVIKGIREENIIPEGPFSATVAMEGRSLSCSINGTTLVETEFLDPSLDHGGVGIKIWDPVPGESSLILESLSISLASTTLSTP